VNLFFHHDFQLTFHGKAAQKVDQIFIGHQSKLSRNSRKLY
jgi:hypothetical protein